MKAEISITPNESLADEEVKISVNGLRSYQMVTIHAVLKGNVGGIFDSFAHYTASANGSLDLGRDASTAGSYTGIERMGLFWSMKPYPGNKRPTYRITITDLEDPVVITFRIFDSHLKYEYLCRTTTDCISQAFVRRWYKSQGVKRILVRWKRVRGTLFIPEGTGPFPGLIDVYGMAGRLVEYRASLLASRGYTSLALAYCDYDDLPQLWDGIDLEYFEEAKEFLEARPEVDQQGIGIVGNSYGGMLALACASYIPGFKCAVSINGPVFFYRSLLQYKGRKWEPRLGNLDYTYEENGAVAEKYCFDEDYKDFAISRDSVIDFAGSHSSFLFIFGKDDNALNNLKAVSLTESLIQNGKGEYEIVTYPGAGHLLEPPHFPHISITYFKLLSEHRNWGGEPKQHAKAQELAWVQIMRFLDKNLRKKTSKL